MCRHRILSRNTASSRAIPFEKMVKDVQENPFIPIAWQKSHKGMQGYEYITSDYDIAMAQTRWLRARDEVVNNAQILNSEVIGITKQLCNRLLEPFVWTTELITTGEEGLMNFFELRCPQYSIETLIDGDNRVFKSKKDFLKELDYEPIYPDSNLDWLKINKGQAEIHIQKIAEMMWDCYNENKPKQLQAGEWHIPFGDRITSTQYYPNYGPNKIMPIKIATARCARLSYMTFDGEIDYEKDIKLHDRLLESKHLSCFEHCARAMSNEEYNTFIKGILSLSEVGRDIVYYEKDRDQKDNLGWCNNFKGFIQYRYLIENK